MSDGACGDDGVATKEEYVEILEFTHFVEFFSFRKIGENHKEKSLGEESNRCCCVRPRDGEHKES